MDPKLINDDKRFWKTVKPMFSDKHFSNNKITLIESNEIIFTEKKDVAETFNTFFANAVRNLNIKGYETHYCTNPKLDDISNITLKLKDHPSVLLITEKIMVKEKFHFFPVNEGTISEQINLLDKRKPTTYNNIPAKILVGNCDIISPFITEMFNESKSKADFPNPMKLADITPAHKKEERTLINLKNI